MKTWTIFFFPLIVIGIEIEIGKIGQVAAGNVCPSISGYAVVHCPEGWVRYKQEKCFKLYTQGESYDKAKKSCEDKNAVLASIHSDEEANFLNSYVLKTVAEKDLLAIWIGGMKIGSIWIWADMSSFTYANWWKGNPEENEGTCMAIGTYKSRLFEKTQDFGKMTNYHACNISSPFLCQKDQIDTRKVIYLR